MTRLQSFEIDSLIVPSLFKLFDLNWLFQYRFPNPLLHGQMVNNLNVVNLIIWRLQIDYKVRIWFVFNKRFISCTGKYEENLNKSSSDINSISFKIGSLTERIAWRTVLSHSSLNNWIFLKIFCQMMSAFLIYPTFLLVPFGASTIIASFHDKKSYNLLWSK